MPHRDEVQAFLGDPTRLRFDRPRRSTTDKPELYRRHDVRRRLDAVLMQLSPELFRQLRDDRHLQIWVSAMSLEDSIQPTPRPIDPHLDGAYAVRGVDLNDPNAPEFRGLDEWTIKLGRVAIESAADLPQAFAGIVIHECCHAKLNHPRRSQAAGRVETQEIEDQVCAEACRLGFREQTAAFLALYDDKFPDRVGIMGRLPSP